MSIVVSDADLKTVYRALFTNKGEVVHENKVVQLKANCKQLRF